MVNIHALTQHITPSYNNKMANVSWPQIPLRNFTLLLGVVLILYLVRCLCHHSISMFSLYKVEGRSHAKPQLKSASRFDTIPACDGRTDGQTDGHRP